MPSVPIAGEYLSELRATPVIEDPYSHYAALRSAGPVVFAQAHGVWVVSGYAACAQVLKEGPAFKPIDHLWPRGDADEAVSSATTHGGGSAGALQPSSHARLTPAQSAVYRTLVAAQRAMRTQDIERVVSRTIDGFVRRGRVEVVGEFARPLVMAVIGELFGFGHELWTAFCTAFLEQRRPALPPEARARRDRLNPFGSLPALRAALHADIRTQLGQPRRREREDVLGVLAGSCEDAADLDQLALARMLAAVAPNAVVTTVDFLGNALWLIASTPGLQAQLIAYPGHINNAIEEALRLESPMQAQFFQAVTTTELAGVTLPAGARLLVLLASANRDAGVFADPERFDAGRANARAHLAFSYGPGACIGAPIVRRLGAVALPAVLSLLPGLRLQPNHAIQHAHTRYNRGLKSLWLDFDRR